MVTIYPRGLAFVVVALLILLALDWLNIDWRVGLLAISLDELLTLLFPVFAGHTARQVPVDIRRYGGVKSSGINSMATASPSYAVDGRSAFVYVASTLCGGLIGPHPTLEGAFGT